VKQSIFLQILVICLIVFGWNVFHLAYNYQKNYYETQLSEKPMILVSPYAGMFSALEAQIDTFRSVDFIVVESDSVIAEMLIESYDLGSASDLIGNFNLPSIMKIYLNGKYYDLKQKTSLENIISSGYPEIVINYDDNYWHDTQQKNSVLFSSYLFGNIFLIVFLLIISVFLRLHFESRSNEYWRVFKNSGGNLRLRKKKYWLNSLLICFIPILLAIGAYFGLKYLQLLPIEMDLRFFAGEFIFILLSVLISRIILGKHI
jgi:hypothetical protein